MVVLVALVVVAVAVAVMIFARLLLTHLSRHVRWHD
jgi:hypothetical protein